MSGNLLVVDWDYFFPNPLEGGFRDKSKDIQKDSTMLYDWGHRESEFFINALWGHRASSFLMNNLPLPTVEPSWKSFPERFTLSEDAVIYIHDSNMHSGLIDSPDGGPFEDVWLYDAHHDSGYGVKSFAEWMSKHVSKDGAEFSCEDWMLIHYMQGTYLHWRWPTWHQHFTEMGPVAIHSTWPEGVAMDAKRDDLKPVDVVFDAVSICRSGAWVPPWEDRKFLEFTELWDRDIEQLDTDDLDRGFDIEAAKREAELLRLAMHQARG